MLRKCVAGKIVFLMILILCVPVIGFAKTGYVSDSLILTFREGPGRDYPVIQSLRSDTPVTILEEKEKYYKVQLESGAKGWVDRQYIVFSPTKTMIIDDLNKEKQELEKQLDSMKSAMERKASSVEDARESKKQLAVELAAVKEENKALSEKLAQAKADYDQLKAQNQDGADLLEKNKILAKANTQLLEKVNTLKARQRGKFSFLKEPGLIKWFLAGVGVLLLGWLLGHSVSSRKDKRRSLLD